MEYRGSILTEELVSKKYRFFIWAIVIVLVVGAGLWTYVYVTGVDLESAPFISGPISQKGTIDVSSEPQGAKIYLDDQDTGKQTNDTLKVKKGTHTIKLTKEGYADYIEEVEVKRGKTVEVSATLEKGEGVATPADETADWKTYTNEEYGYSIKYLNNYTYRRGTISEDDKLNTLSIIHFYDEKYEYSETEYGYPTFYVAVYNNPNNLEVSQWWTSLFEREKNSLTSQEFITVAGEKAWKVFDQLGMVEHHDIYIPHKGRIYTISEFMDENNFEKAYLTFRFTK